MFLAKVPKWYIIVALTAKEGYVENLFFSGIGAQPDKKAKLD